MQNSKVEVFISHASENLYLIDQFIAMIRNVGISHDIFCSSRNGEGVKSGDKINDTIVSKMRISNFIIYFISNDFINSPYCMQELGMSYLVSGHSLYLITPDISIDSLKGFVNSKIHKFTLLNNADSIEEMFTAINNNMIQPNISSNAIRTFLSATEHYFKQLVDKRKKQEDDIEYITNELKQLKQEKAEFKKEIDKQCDLTRIELYELLFDYSMLGPDLSQASIRTFEKDFWFTIKKDYEKLCTKHNYRINSTMCFAFMNIYTAFDMMEDAYNYLIKGVKRQGYLYLHQFDAFLDKYKKSMLTLIMELNSINGKMEPSSSKDVIESIISQLLEREKTITGQ